MADARQRVPSDDLDILAKKEEPRFLSMLLKDKDKLMDAIGFGITPDHFRIPDNEYLFAIIKKNFEQFGSLLTRSAMDSIVDRQSKYTDEQKAARRQYYDKVYHMAGVSYEDYALFKDSIHGRALQEKLYGILQDNMAEVVGSTSNQEELVKRIQGEINGIEGVGADNFTQSMNAQEGIQFAMDHITERRDHPERNPAVLTGIKGIDDEYCGFAPGSYTIISGMTNGGKTTLMFNIAFNMARAGYNVVYLSLEKEAGPLWVRLLCLHAMVDYNRTKRGGKEDWGIPDHIYNLLQAKADELLTQIVPTLEIIQLPQNVTLTKSLAEVERVAMKMKPKEIDVLVVDYLGCLGFETHHPSRPDLDQAVVSKRLQAYGKIHKYVTITAVQIKGAATKDLRKRAEKATETDEVEKVAVYSEDLAGSQEVIRDADNSIGVVLNADQPPTKMFVHGTKARDDQGHRTITLDFDGRCGKISDPENLEDQIEETDDLVYNTNISEDSLLADDDLFTMLENEQSQGDSLELDFDVDESKTQDESVQESSEDDIFGEDSKPEPEPEAAEEEETSDPVVPFDGSFDDQDDYLGIE